MGDAEVLRFIRVSFVNRRTRSAWLPRPLDGIRFSGALRTDNFTCRQTFRANSGGLQEPDARRMPVVGELYARFALATGKGPLDD